MFRSRRHDDIPAADTPRTAESRLGQPSATSTSDTGLSAVVDASRRIVGLRSREEIHRAAVTEAVSLTQAEAGAFVTTPAGDVARAQFVFMTHPQLFSGSTIEASILRRTLVDREPVCEIVGSEPVLAFSPLAMAAVPAVAGGGVVGLLIVVRSAEEPFGNAELEILNMLAPATGAAHTAAAPVAERDELDAVTRLGNRRRLDRDLVDLSREGKVGFCMVKVDFFDAFVAAHGVAVGDELLRRVALTIKSDIRPDDIAYRAGEAEFGVLLPLASKEDAAWVAERIRQSVSVATLGFSNHVPTNDARATAGTGNQSAEGVTVSIGVTAGNNEDPQLLTERALAAVREAEEAGHDRVITDEAI